MVALTTGDDAVGSLLRAGILESMFHEPDDEYILVDTSGEESAVSDSDEPQQLIHPRAEELEEVLYSMAIWLLSHQVLGHVQEYLVLPGNTAIPLDPDHDANAKNTPDQLSSSEASISDDVLLRELQDLVTHLGADRPMALARELTKLHEEVVRGPLGLMVVQVFQA